MMNRRQRIEAALTKMRAKAAADPDNEKVQAKIEEYKTALDNIAQYGRPEGPKPPPHKGDANINL